MWNYIIDGIFIGIIVISVIIGIAKGFFDSLLSLIGTGVAFAAAIFLGKYVANFINKIFDFENFILEKIDASNADGVVSFFGGKFELSNVEVAKFCVWVCAVIVVFIAIKLVLLILSKLFEAVVRNSPTISGINRVLGLIFGLLRGGVMVVVMLAICSLLYHVPSIGENIHAKISETTITSKVYDYVDNFVEKYLTKDTIDDIIDRITSENDTDNNDETNSETVVESVIKEANIPETYLELDN